MNSILFSCESWDLVGEDKRKISTVRTHPEELRALQNWAWHISKAIFRGAQFFGMSSYDQIFFVSKSMDLKLFKTVPGIVLRRLLNFLEHETHLQKIDFLEGGWVLTWFGNGRQKIHKIQQSVYFDLSITMTSESVQNTFNWSKEFIGRTFRYEFLLRTPPGRTSRHTWNP